ncbi:Uncharacterised protein [Mycobacterium tuberculosis]|nr:Uncharacterised protein [Mycobacterium tuberculosis]
MRSLQATARLMSFVPLWTCGSSSVTGASGDIGTTRTFAASRYRSIRHSWMRAPEASAASIRVCSPMVSTMPCR